MNRNKSVIMAIGVIGMLFFFSMVVFGQEVKKVSTPSIKFAGKDSSFKTIKQSNMLKFQPKKLTTLLFLKLLITKEVSIKQLYGRMGWVITNDK